MAEPAIILQLPPGDLEARPITSYAEKWGATRKTLNDWCAKGKIPGAFHGPDGSWWVHPIKLMGIDLEALQSTKERNEKIKGKRNGRSDPQSVASTLDSERQKRIW